MLLVESALLEGGYVFVLFFSFFFPFSGHFYVVTGSYEDRDESTGGALSISEYFHILPERL